MEALTEVEHIARRVAGSAAALGFVAAAEAARDLELAVHSIVSRQRPWSAGMELAVDLLLDRLRVEVGKAAQAGA